MKTIIFCALALATCSGVAAEPQTAAPTGVAAFLTELDALRSDAHIPGLSVAVVRDGEILLAAGLGYANIEQGVAATAQTPYDIASVTKPLSAVVALKLVEAGTLDLDKPIASYSDWTEFCQAFSEQPSIFAQDLRCEPPTHTLRHLLSHTATGEPGTRFSYNPILYSWASRPIMAVTDATFSSLVAQHVFAPAGMQQSARRYRDLPLRADLAARLTTSYQIDEAGVARPSGPRSRQGDGAAGGVISTVLDLAAFDIALDDGKLISADSRAEMMTPMRSNSGAALDYGLGWYLQDYDGLSLVWHSGWWEDAASSLYLKVPEQNLSLILLANSEGIWWHNPLDEAAVEQSRFAQAFLSAFAQR